MLLHSAPVDGLDQLTCRVFDSTRSSGARLAAYRIDGTFFVDMDLPGADPAGIDVSMDGGVLTVRAERRRTGEPAPAHGPISREVDLSETDRLDTDRLEASCDEGVLTLRIPVVHQAEASELAGANV